AHYVESPQPEESGSLESTSDGAGQRREGHAAWGHAGILPVHYHHPVYFPGGRRQNRHNALEASARRHGVFHQRVGIEFAIASLKAGKGALIADDMGLGKSFQALSVIALNPSLKSVLILCPASLKYNWAAEVEKHYPSLSYVVIDGNAATRQQLWRRPSRLKIANYELLLHDVEPRVFEWDLVVGDECTRLKSWKAQTSKRAKKLRRRYSLGLSGAPIQNRLEEFHSIMDFVIPGLLGPGWQFVRDYCIKNYWGTVVGYQNLERFKAKVAPHFIRRLKKAVLPELPDKVYTDCNLELSSEEWRLYDAVRDQILTLIRSNDKLQVSNILTMMLRLKQIVDDSRLVGESIASSKMGALKEILEVAQEHKIVVFTQFAKLAIRLGVEYKTLVIHGGVASKDRVSIVERFNNDDGPRVLISTDAGAYGLNMTAADIIIHIEQPWNP
ncbi:hypothetical protein LCGC14_2677210, partial [marine sediment metagenome]